MCIILKCINILRLFPEKKKQKICKISYIRVFTTFITLKKTYTIFNFKLKKQQILLSHMTVTKKKLSSTKHENQVFNLPFCRTKLGRKKTLVELLLENSWSFSQTQQINNTSNNYMQGSGEIFVTITCNARMNFF